MDLKQKIIEFYKRIHLGDELQSYSCLKLYMLYPLTIMDNHLLDIISGIATALSINILTGLVVVQFLEWSDFFLWIGRLFSAFVVNWCLVRLTIISTILRIDAQEKSADVPVERDRRIQYRRYLLDNYNKYYAQVKKCVINGALSLIVLMVLVIVVPILILFNRCPF